MLFQSADIFYPTDVAVMQRAFDKHCADFQYPPHSPAAEGVAATIVALFKMGFTDEESLADALAGQAYIWKAG